MEVSIHPPRLSIGLWDALSDMTVVHAKGTSQMLRSQLITVIINSDLLQEVEYLESIIDRDLNLCIRG